MAASVLSKSKVRLKEEREEKGKIVNPHNTQIQSTQ